MKFVKLLALPLTALMLTGCGNYARSEYIDRKDGSNYGFRDYYNNWDSILIHFNSDFTGVTQIRYGTMEDYEIHEFTFELLAKEHVKTSVVVTGNNLEFDLSGYFSLNSHEQGIYVIEAKDIVCTYYGTGPFLE